MIDLDKNDFILSVWIIHDGCYENRESPWQILGFH